MNPATGEGPASRSGEVTDLLAAWSGGDQEALARLTPLIYDELRAIARRYLRRERTGHTLQPTALVHEAYLRLVDQRRACWQHRSQFFAVAATLMRRILVDHARHRGAGKRGGDAPRLALEEAGPVAEPEPPADLVALDDALAALAAFDPFAARLVELRFFAGLPLAEAAEVLGCSRATAVRRWRTAKLWLHHELSGER